MSVTSEREAQLTAQSILQHIGAYAVRNHGGPLVLAVGLPGTGKSTFCRQLAKRTDAALLESDRLRSSLFSPPSFDSAENRRLFGSIRAATSLLLNQGASVIVDATNLRESDRNEFYDVAAQAGARILIVHFVAPETAILERFKARSKHLDPEDGSSATLAVYRRMVQTQEPILRDHRIVDTSSPEDVEFALSQLALQIEGKPITSSTTGGNIS